MMSLLITECLTRFFLALTPVQRWSAMRKHNQNIFANRIFFKVGVIVIIVLTAMFFVITCLKKYKEKKSIEGAFDKNAEEKGLTDRERQILRRVVRCAELKRSVSIFTLHTAFDRGAAGLIEESLAKYGEEKNKQLHIEISSLREKLGFRRQNQVPVESIVESQELSSKQLAVSKQLHLRHPKIYTNDDIESTIIENSEVGLRIQLSEPMEITFGQSWRARYYSGASLWEFDTTVISCNGDIVVLEHSDNIRVINRRRFLRVPVKKTACVASFPFVKRSIDSAYSSDGHENASDESLAAMAPPVFTDAVVTELGGPGLRIESELPVRVGEKVLLVFKLIEQVDRNNKIVTEKIIEVIGMVRHVRAMESGSSFAVESTGLNEAEISELIRATNSALVRKVPVNDRDIQSHSADDQNVQENTDNVQDNADKVVIVQE